MTTMEPIAIKVPDACVDCGDTNNGSHTCDGTPHRNTPQLWRCWGCKDGNHADVECAFRIALQRRLNFGECLCCKSTDFASESVMCKGCDQRARMHPEIMNYDGCRGGCGRTATFSEICRFCEVPPDQAPCPGCGELGWGDSFCSTGCMKKVYDPCYWGCVRGEGCDCSEERLEDESGCIGCGQAGYTNDFCSRECMLERYDSQ